MHGERTVVVMDMDEFERLEPPKQHLSIIELLRNAPKLDMTDEEIDALFARSEDVARDPFEDWERCGAPVLSPWSGRRG